MKVTDVRWFSDKRPTCVIEYEYMKRLGAVTDRQYAAQLQKEGLKLFEEHVRKTPKLTISAINQ